MTLEIGSPSLRKPSYRKLPDAAAPGYTGRSRDVQEGETLTAGRRTALTALQKARSYSGAETSELIRRPVSETLMNWVKLLGAYLSRFEDEAEAHGGRYSLSAVELSRLASLQEELTGYSSRISRVLAGYTKTGVSGHGNAYAGNAIAEGGIALPMALGPESHLSKVRFEDRQTTASALALLIRGSLAVEVCGENVLGLSAAQVQKLEDAGVRFERL